MLEEKDKDMQSLDFSDEMDDDLNYARNRSRRPPTDAGTGLPFRWIIIGAAGFLLVILLSIGVFGRGNRVSTDEFNAVRSAVQHIEQQLQAMEIIIERVAIVESQEAELRASIQNMNQTLGTVSQRLATLTQKVESAQQMAPAARSSTTPARAQGTAVHEVKRGETLYAIARKYNMTIEDLARVNKLGRDRTIHPGQKLVVNR